MHAYNFSFKKPAARPEKAAKQEAFYSTVMTTPPKDALPVW
ncbi:hypothetical protein [Holospora undulata]|nr:hypothetical protein [Holospora undulata]